MVEFTFQNRWFQTAGKTYLIVIRDPQAYYSWGVNSTGPFTTDCAYMVQASFRDCSYRFYHTVLFEKINCCASSCFNDGVCQSSGSCSCKTGSFGDGCKQGKNMRKK